MMVTFWVNIYTNRVFLARLRAANIPTKRRLTRRRARAGERAGDAAYSPRGAGEGQE